MLSHVAEATEQRAGKAIAAPGRSPCRGDLSAEREIRQSINKCEWQHNMHHVVYSALFSEFTRVAPGSDEMLERVTRAFCP